MAGVSLSRRTSPPGKPGINPTVLGAVYCAIAALGYTGSNMCLRSLSASADQVWSLCIKEAVTVAVVGPWLLWVAGRRLCKERRESRGRREERGGIAQAGPLLRALGVLALVGIAVQMVGNLGVIWAFGLIGLAVTVPLVSAANLGGSALLGRWVLGERVSPRSGIAVGSLIVSISLLSMGAGSGGPMAAADAVPAGDGALARWAVGAACLGGLVFAFMSVAIRKNVVRAVPPTAVVLVITGMGVLVLGPLALWRHGLPGLLSIRGDHLALMLLSGVLNLVAFLSYTKALRLITVVHASVLSAAQVALAALAGIWFFSEKPSLFLFAGVCLTIVGIFVVERPAEDDRPAAVSG
jgi:DME family drug/metabolite transporter